MKKLIAAALVLVLASLVMTAHSGATLKRPKRVSGTVEINPIPTIPIHSGLYLAIPVSGNLETSRYCRNGRDVEFSYPFTQEILPPPVAFGQTSPNGDFSGTLPPPPGIGISVGYPMSHSRALAVRVVEEYRKVRVKKKGTKKKVVLRFNCLEAIGRSSVGIYG